MEEPAHGPISGAQADDADRGASQESDAAASATGTGQVTIDRPVSLIAGPLEVGLVSLPGLLEGLIAQTSRVQMSAQAQADEERIKALNTANLKDDKRQYEFWIRKLNILDPLFKNRCVFLILFCVCNPLLFIAYILKQMQFLIAHESSQKFLEDVESAVTPILFFQIMLYLAIIYARPRTSMRSQAELMDLIMKQVARPVEELKRQPQIFRDEINELQGTIKSLRDEIESLNAGHQRLLADTHEKALKFFDTIKQRDRHKLRESELRENTLLMIEAFPPYVEQVKTPDGSVLLSVELYKKIRNLLMNAALQCASATVQPEEPEEPQIVEIYWHETRGETSLQSQFFYPRFQSTAFTRSPRAPTRSPPAALKRQRSATPTSSRFSP